MIVLDINNISKRYLSEPILERISCKIEQGGKVGLIGANGCGKSTLLKLIAGVEDPSSGVIARPTGATVGYLAQEMEYGQERTVRQEVLHVFADLEELRDRLPFRPRRRHRPAGERLLPLLWRPRPLRPGRPAPLLR